MLAEVHALASCIHRARQDLSALGADDIVARHVPAASDELDAVVTHTEPATGTILDECEALEQAVTGTACHAVVSAAAGRIYEACSFQDITGQRVAKVVHTLQIVEARVASDLARVRPCTRVRYRNRTSPSPCSTVHSGRTARWTRARSMRCWTASIEGRLPSCCRLCWVQAARRPRSPLTLVTLGTHERPRPRRFRLCAGPDVPCREARERRCAALPRRRRCSGAGRLSRREHVPPVTGGPEMAKLTRSCLRRHSAGHPAGQPGRGRRAGSPSPAKRPARSHRRRPGSQPPAATPPDRLPRSPSRLRLCRSLQERPETVAPVPITRPLPQPPLPQPRAADAPRDRSRRSSHLRSPPFTCRWPDRSAGKCGAAAVRPTGRQRRRSGTATRPGSSSTNGGRSISETRSRTVTRSSPARSSSCCRTRRCLRIKLPSPRDMTVWSGKPMAGR